MPSKRKTVRIEELVKFVNQELAHPGSTKQGRYALICMLERFLFETKQWRGYRYLTDKEVHPEEKPGIRTVVNTDDMDMETKYKTEFEDTDSTRRRYG